MAEREEVGDRTIRVPEHLIETINRLVRTSRQMLTEIGREPTPEELAEKLAMPLEKVRKVLNIAKQPITLAAPIGSAGQSRSRLILRRDELSCAVDVVSSAAIFPLVSPTRSRGGEREAGPRRTPARRGGGIRRAVPGARVPRARRRQVHPA